MCLFRFWPKLRVLVPGVCVYVSVSLSCPLYMYAGVCPSTSVCHCTRVCGCAARRLMDLRLAEHSLCCVVRAEFYPFLVFAENRNFYCSPSRRERPVPVSPLRYRVLSRRELLRGETIVGRSLAPRLCVSSCAQPRTAMNRIRNFSCRKRTQNNAGKTYERKCSRVESGIVVKYRNA